MKLIAEINNGTINATFTVKKIYSDHLVKIENYYTFEIHDKETMKIVTQKYIYMYMYNSNLNYDHFTFI